MCMYYFDTKFHKNEQKLVEGKEEREEERESKGSQREGKRLTVLNSLSSAHLEEKLVAG